MRRRIFSLLDLTRLNDDDTIESITALCSRACDMDAAAVCVYPHFVKDAVRELAETEIKVASVANFPHGTDAIEKTLTLAAFSVAEGASEIDVVFPYKRYLEGDKEGALEVITACQTLGGTLKVILETGVISDLVMIENISKAVIASGADFLKTSTGKTPVGATLEAAEVMLRAIKMSGRDVGFKASGGIRTIEQAMQYIQLAEEIMGKEWVTPERFRIGTSGLS